MCTLLCHHVICTSTYMYMYIVHVYCTCVHVLANVYVYTGNFGSARKLEQRKTKHEHIHTHTHTHTHTHLYRRDRLWIAMEYCGGGSLQDIYHGELDVLKPLQLDVILLWNPLSIIVFFSLSLSLSL